MSKELENLLEDLDCGEEVKTKYGLCYAYSPDIVEELQQAILELKAIKEANPSEALNKLDYIKRDIKFAYNADYINFDHTDDINYIKQTLLKVQENEKEKLLFKNLYNTKAKTPLVSIFNGLSQEERFKFTEHIYYNWEEMKEALEDKNQELEGKNHELGKENAEHKRVLEVIFEKKVDIVYLNDSNNVEEYNSHFGCVIYKLTQEEFNLVKGWSKWKKNI